MALIDAVKAVCDRLDRHGWRDLLRAASAGQLDIRQPTTAALRQALLAPLTTVDRTVRGFEDFAPTGRQGVTPGRPAQSLLFHALASPGVRLGPEAPLAAFPTAREIDDVENFVFGAEPPTLAALRQRVGLPASSSFDVVVFAYEYRPAADTCSRAHADLTFSRTGVARVGTRPPLYRAEHRGFQPEVEEEPFAFRVCPAHYGAFLAVRRKPGDGFAPMRPRAGDGEREFWLPVHKLFTGGECIAGLNVSVAFTTFHYNDKIRRVQRLRGTMRPETPPFQLREGIAQMMNATANPGYLCPTVHERLVEPAVMDGKFVTYPVPPGPNGFAAFEPGAQTLNDAEVRPAPAYVHARTKVVAERLFDLNEFADVRAEVAKGGYAALHYVDFTGEGFVDVDVTGLPSTDVAAPSRQAYSLVGAPDFFPSTGQRELTDWSSSAAVPKAVRSALWGVPPAPLSDTRLPANLQMPGHRFDDTEETVTALVPLFGASPSGAMPPMLEDALRHSCLPDDAAGVFAPGWDVSTDKTAAGRPVHHLAAYGLGSPFPEDSKLCAALSTFWPSVAPDITRGMSIHTGNGSLRHTVAPLTDEEIGQVGTLPWDGNRGPQVVTIDGQLFAECESFLHVDYVQAALESRFTARLTGRVTSDEYKRRVLAMAYAYRVLPLTPNDWFVLSFRRLGAGDPELQRAQVDASTVLPGIVFRIDAFRASEKTERVSPTDVRKRLLPITDRRFLIVDPQNRHVLHRRAADALWRREPLTL
jgi:hypothetical protein